MLSLAIETSTKVASIALFRGAELINESTIESGKSASTLVPSIKTLFEVSDESLKTLDAIHIATGPGSFTGLRVGITTAKTLSYAVGCRLIAVNSLHALAHHALTAAKRNSVCVVMDAQRQQLFASLIQLNRDDFVVKKSTQIIERNELKSFADNSPICGPGLRRIDAVELELLDTLPEEYGVCRASSVGILARSGFEQVEEVDCWQLKPNYFRLSTAEEKRIS